MQSVLASSIDDNNRLEYRVSESGDGEQQFHTHTNSGSN